MRASTTVGEIVMFVAFATMLIQKLETGGFLHQQRVHGGAAAARVLQRARRGSGGARPPRRDRHRRLSGLVEFSDVSFSYDGKRPAVEDLSFAALPGQTIALVGPTGAGKSDRDRAVCTARSMRNPASSGSTAWTSAA